MASKFRYDVFVFDSETTGAEYFEQNGMSKVWAWGLAKVPINSKKCISFENHEVKIGRSIQDFIATLESDVISNNSKIYIHNLSFDGQFILNALIRMGYSERTEDELLVCNSRNFAALVTNGEWYSISVFVGEKKVELRDSSKCIPMSVSKMAKEYKLPVVKGSIDYNRDPELELTDSEIVYVRNDVLIVAEVLRQQFQLGFSERTIAAHAFASFQKHLRAQGLSYGELFPTLSDDIDAFCRLGYFGGEVWANPDFAGRIVGSPISKNQIGTVYDINSMFPAMMASMPMPVGEPHQIVNLSLLSTRRSWTAKEWREWRGHTKRAFILVDVDATLKAGRIPSISTTVGKSRKYLSRVNKVMVLADVALERLLEDYNVSSIVVKRVIWFEARSDLFYEYIMSCVEEKNKARAAGDFARANVAKVKMNSLYGKFGQKKSGTRRHFDGMDEFGEIITKTEQCYMTSKYVPLAAIVTAEARDYLISQANKFTSASLTYMDTDSLHVLDFEHEVVEAHLPAPSTQSELYARIMEFKNERPGEIWTDQSALGALKIESTFGFAKYLRAKTYIEGYGVTKKEAEAYASAPFDGEHFLVPQRAENPQYWTLCSIRGSGLPDAQKMQITIENFKIGLVVTGRLIPKDVPGGRVLYPSTFEIREDITVLTSFA